MARKPADKHFYDLVSSFDTAMMISHTQDGRMHSRPMMVAALEPGAHAYFVSDRRSPKVSEIEADPLVHVTFQSSSQYAALSGRVSIETDRAQLDRLWSEAWRVWFPGGKDDPNLVLLRLEPHAGEFWDNSGSEGLQYFFEGMKAYLEGRTPETTPAQHNKVRL